LHDFTIPVILFAYAHPDHLRQTLDCVADKPSTADFGVSAMRRARPLRCQVLLTYLGKVETFLIYPFSNASSVK